MNPKMKNRIVNDLYIFYRVFVASMFKENVHAPHIQKLSKALMNIAYNPSAKNRLCVAMPPQHSKSSIVTLAYTVWLICRDPSLKILVINAEANLSETFGIRIRQLVQVVGPLFGVSVSDVKSSKTHLMFEKNRVLQQGEIRLTGAGGSITGHPVDICIIDDPYKGTDDLSPSLLQKKITWFKLIVEQRLKEDSKLIIVHTRWHSEDLQGYLYENDKDSYDWIIFSAIDENDNILWPQYYSREFYNEKLRRQGERIFQALYQQQPLDLTSDFLHVDHLIFETKFDDFPIARCRSWDIAASDDTLGDERDYTVGVRMLKTPGDQTWIFPYERGQYGNNVKNVIKKTARLDTASHHILLEPGTKGGAAKLLFEEYKSELQGYPVHQSEPVGTKADRATPLANAIYDGKVHVCINNDEQRQTFLDEFKSFPNGKHDDIVDACAYGYLFLQTQDNRLVKTAKKRQRKRLR